jgi:FtsP/CotA-like multicopper oxidase with cupredoxin domain
MKLPGTKTLWSRAGALLYLMALGCAAGSTPVTQPPPSRPAQPSGWDDALHLREAVDINPAPDIVEINLDARVEPVELKPGVITQTWTYDGGVPGPLIRAHVGNRVIVHFTNHLPEDTTVHWHGVRLPAAMDGVPGHTQDAVPPGGSFDYSFVVPDASLFWYHPHFNSAAQVGDGLYGALLVEGDGEPDGLGDPLVLVLSDVSLNDDGTLMDPNSGGDYGLLFGREGNVLLTNGKVAPTILARNGLRQRWRIVNASKARFYQLALEGHTFTRIGGDGGFIETPLESERLLVLPGGRADVLVTPSGQAGTTVPVRWIPFDRGFGATYNRPEEIVFNMQFAGDAPVEDTPVPTRLRTIVPLDLTDSIARSIDLTQDILANKLVLGINGVPSWDAQPFYARVGDTEVWTINNLMAWDHPFHLHGFFFQPLDPVTGAALPSAEWRDTYNVPKNESVKFVVKYDDRPGMWMFHCHVLDHADGGMMGMLMLAPKG